jgi:molybdate transport system substrate-binding protein
MSAARLAPALAAALLAASCGGGADGGSDRLTVAAAASLTEPLSACSRAFDGPRVALSFAGSDELAAQIRQGVRPDVFAAANTTLPDALYRERRVERPRRFATNQLVVVVPRDSPVRRVEDLAGADVTVATGAPSVPVGAYTRAVLARLPGGVERRIVRNIRTEEPDVRGIVGKVTQRAVDAGFAYATDVAAAGDRLRASRLAPSLRPTVAYEAAVVRGAANAEAARRYLGGLVRGGCRRALDGAGFGPPPA